MLGLGVAVFVAVAVVLVLGLFRLTSADVIHSFWVPALAGKVDLLPDRTNTLVLQADEAGRHTSRCAEFCGLQHTKMVLTVVAEPEDQFAAWWPTAVADQDPPRSAGRRRRCSARHS